MDHSSGPRNFKLLLDKFFRILRYFRRFIMRKVWLKMYDLIKLGHPSHSLALTSPRGWCLNRPIKSFRIWVSQILKSSPIRFNRFGRANKLCAIINLIKCNLPWYSWSLCFYLIRQRDRLGFLDNTNSLWKASNDILVFRSLVFNCDWRFLLFLFLIYEWYLRPKRAHLSYLEPSQSLGTL